MEGRWQNVTTRSAHTLGLSLLTVYKQLREELCRQLNAMYGAANRLIQRAKVNCIATEGILRQYRQYTLSGVPRRALVIVDLLMGSLRT